MTKEKRISAELKRLEAIFDGNTEGLPRRLIDNAAFIAVSLEDLQKALNEKGFVEEYNNGGGQSGYKKTSEADIYSTLVKNYTTIVKQLADLEPDKKNEADDLIDFIKRK